MLRRILFLTVVVSTIISSAASPKKAQQNKIILKERKMGGIIPYQINNIQLNGDALKVNSSFSVSGSGDEWEKKLTFSFVNTSNKNITHMFIKLLLPVSDKSKPSVLVPFFGS